MSGIKIMTDAEAELITKLYKKGETNIRVLTDIINGNRDNDRKIKSITTVKNYLVRSDVYIKKIHTPVRLNKILVDHKEKTEIMKILETTLPTIRKALNGNCGSEISIKIRKVAIERGGVENIPQKNI